MKSSVIGSCILNITIKNFWNLVLLIFIFTILSLKEFKIYCYSVKDLNITFKILCYSNLMDSCNLFDLKDFNWIWRYIYFFKRQLSLLISNLHDPYARKYVKIEVHNNEIEKLFGDIFMWKIDHSKSNLLPTDFKNIFVIIIANEYIVPLLIIVRQAATQISLTFPCISLSSIQIQLSIFLSHLSCKNSYVRNLIVFLKKYFYWLSLVMSSSIYSQTSIGML